MGDARQYCLKWNNHPRNVATVFDRWRESTLSSSLFILSSVFGGSQDH